MPWLQEFSLGYTKVFQAEAWPPTAIATAQHAMLRGIEVVFQLEEGEVLADPLPYLLRASAELAAFGATLEEVGEARILAHALESGLDGRIRRKLHALHKLLNGNSVRVFIGDGRGPDPVDELLNGGGTVAVGRVA